jgi:hypothetical protein
VDQKNIRMANVFSDFGAFMAHALDELKDTMEAVGWFEDCDYEKAGDEVDER